MSAMGPGRTHAHTGFVQADRFKEVLASVPMPVTIVTTVRDGQPHGTTVSAFASLSLRPPLILVSLDRDSQLLRLLRETRRFGVNVLQHEQEQHALRFSRKGSDKFRDVDWTEDHGLPHLSGSAAWIVCRTVELFPGGDHLIVTGMVEHAERMPHQPLIYRERSFARLEGRSREP